jgi:hypothetical protein
MRWRTVSTRTNGGVRAARRRSVGFASFEKGHLDSSVVTLIVAMLAAAFAIVLWTPAPGSASARGCSSAAAAEPGCPPKDPRGVEQVRKMAQEALARGREAEKRRSKLAGQARRLEALAEAVELGLDPFPYPLLNAKQMRELAADYMREAKDEDRNVTSQYHLSYELDALADDPPDDNFQEVATPQRAPWKPARGGPRALRRARNAHGKTIARLNAVLGAATTALERSAGAQSAGNATWTRTQLQAAARYTRTAARSLAKLPNLRARVRRALDYAEVSIDVDARMLAAVKRDVRRHGMPEIRAAFRRLGIPKSELTQLKRAILNMSLRELRRANPWTGGASDKTDRRTAAALGDYAGDLELTASAITEGGEGVPTTFIGTATRQSQYGPYHIITEDRQVTETNRMTATASFRLADIADDVAIYDLQSGAVQWEARQVGSNGCSGSGAGTVALSAQDSLLLYNFAGPDKGKYQIILAEAGAGAEYPTSCWTDGNVSPALTEVFEWDHTEGRTQSSALRGSYVASDPPGSVPYSVTETWDFAGTGCGLASTQTGGGYTEMAARLKGRPG